MLEFISLCFYVIIYVFCIVCPDLFGAVILSMSKQLSIKEIIKGEQYTWDIGGHVDLKRKYDLMKTKYD